MSSDFSKIIGHADEEKKVEDKSSIVTDSIILRTTNRGLVYDSIVLKIFRDFCENLKNFRKTKN